MNIIANNIMNIIANNIYYIINNPCFGQIIIILIKDRIIYYISGHNII